ncbi:MAG: helix-turn-helix transcriptional regulator [Bacteroidota bacterium]
MQTTTTSLVHLFQQIGSKLYSIRHSRNEKLTSVASSIGFSHTVISQIENGRYKGLSIKTLHQLASYYKVPLEEILASTDNDCSSPSND